MLSDVYEPTVDNTDVSTLQYVVTDGSTFTDLQTRDMTYTVAADPTGMSCTVTSTDAKHGFRLVTTYLTDPARDTVLMHTTLQDRRARHHLAGLRLYARLDAHVNGNGGGGAENAGANTGVVDTSAGAPVPVVSSTNTVTDAVNRDYAVPTYMALDATPTRRRPSATQGTASDGLTQLDATHTLTPYTSAPDGHIVATENVTPGSGHAVTLALGFGRSQAQSVSVAEASAGPAVRPDRGRSTCSAGPPTTPGCTRGFPGGQAGQAQPALLPVGQRPEGQRGQDLPGRHCRLAGQPVGTVGAGRGDRHGEPSYFGSYREVFARDLYEAFTGLMADGDIATARAATLFLFDRQQLPSGAMPRNSLLNGQAAPDTGGLQLDETAYPILMAQLSGLGGDNALWQATSARPPTSWSPTGPRTAWSAGKSRPATPRPRSRPRSPG